jgi:hypothetical protein
MGLYMNGNDWIKSNTNYVRSTSNHTVMYWLRLDNSSSTRRPFGSTGSWEARTSGTTLVSDYLQSGTLGEVTLTVGTYHHVAFVQNVSGSARYAYLDGVLVDTVNSASFSGQQSGTVSIGVTAGGSSQGWYGAMDDIRVYNRVMLADEIQTIYACQGTDGLYEDLVLWYLMNEGAEGSTATTVYDQGSSGINCSVVTGTPIYNYDAGIKYERTA